MESFYKFYGSNLQEIIFWGTEAKAQEALEIVNQGREVNQYSLMQLDWSQELEDLDGVWTAETMDI